MGKIFSASLFCLLSCISVFSQEAQKIDEFGIASCEDYLARMDNVMIAAQNNPTSQIYILIYDGREIIYKSNGKQSLVFPAVGSAKAKIRSMKKLIVLRKESVDRYVFVEAGFREGVLTEFWLVPQGSAPPKPAPTITKMKYRKGKAKGYCLSCCEN